MCAMLPSVALADCDCDFPDHISIDNWQTFHPRVTALRSLNAYLATDKGQQVYYVPTLDELPGVENAITDCIDYAGHRYRFAAVYDGYFDQMCYEALVRKSDGSYSRVPAIVQTAGSNRVRELTTLGYDFLLTQESVSNIVIDDDRISADYNAHRVDSVNGYVDLNTALMDIYKAVGQEKYDIVYAFANDPEMTVENSPIQKEISVLISNTESINTSAGQGWIFATRTNPNLYWKQAAYDGIIWDAEALHEDGITTAVGSNNTKAETVTLAEFCMYAYNIMHIYGEPVMTQSERNILLQLYGSTVPYKACIDEEVTAIETFIAKGIISPEEDEQYLAWNSNINFDYMLTLLMRMKDVNARKTYKDIQITMDVSMINNNYYNAKLEYEQSNIVEFSEAVSAAKVTNYYDAKLGVTQFERMASTLNTSGVSMELFIPTHLVFVGPDDSVFPLSTQVTTHSQKVYSVNHPNSPYVLTNTTVDDGQLMQFCISDGIQTDDSGRFLHLRMAAFTVNDLLHSDGTYHLHLVNDRGELSSSAFKIRPGGGIYYESGVRSEDDDDVLTDDDEDDDMELTNEAEIDELIEIFDEEGELAAKRRLSEMLKNHPEWTTYEVQAAQYAASDGDYLSAKDTAIMYMRIVAGSESNIMVTTLNGETVKLSDIMSVVTEDGVRYADPDNKSDLSFYRINSTTYQVDNCSGIRDLNERVKSSSVEGVETAYCKRDTELMVSTKWLQGCGLISTTPLENDNILMLSTQYANIYLDKKNKYIVSGASVYDVKNIDESEIWIKSGDDLFVNFRAVLGWTGDFMIFKNVGGSISVSIQDTATFNPYSESMASRLAITIKMSDVTTSVAGIPRTSGNTVAVQGFKDTMAYRDRIPMVSMYPFANYFVYITSNVLDDSEEYHDWLFVFKPKKVNVNGTMLEYDDTESRKCLRDAMNISLDSLDDDITVWAYPLYRGNVNNKGMPKGMTYDDQHGYRYRPETLTNTADILANYFNTDVVMSGTGEPSFVLPFYKDGNGDIRCFNYNTYTVEDTSGNEAMLKYGEMPAKFVLNEAMDNTLWSSGLAAINNLTYTLFGVDAIPVITPNNQYNLDECTVTPAVTSPALWFLELQKYDFQTVMANLNSGSSIYWGTNKVVIREVRGRKTLSVGAEDKTDELSNMEFLLMRETASSTSTIGRWYSVSALNSFKLEPIIEGGTGTTEIGGPSSGLLTSAVDVIDWDEFKTERLLESGEFVVAIALILILGLLPRLALFAFLTLTALGVIQNVKVWQLFCDKIFDPYKLLTAGRRDVHTFRPGRAFITSIVAMAVFALFMDGTIIHVYEWIMQFIGAFLSN